MEFKGLDYVNGVAKKPKRGWWETINGRKGTTTPEVGGAGGRGKAE